MLTIAICDKTESMRNLLEEKICESFSRNCEIKKYKDAESLLEEIDKKIFNVLFIDIDLPVMNGMDLAKKIKKENNPNSKIIFVTDIEDYVFEAYKYAFRYIRKSHMDNEISACITDLKRALIVGNTTRIFPTYKGNVRVRLKDIVYADVLDHRLTIYIGNKELNVYMTMDELDKRINKFGFIRVHKSFLVNYRFIDSIYGNDVILNNEIKIPLSKKRAKEVKNRLCQLAKCDYV